MKVSLAWLKQLLKSDTLTGSEAARLLTGAGIEVESVARIGHFSGVIVAEVRGKRPHPDAQKLTLVDVWDGTTTTQVVCGAPNVPEPGHRVLWAKPGSKLPMGEGGALIDIQPKAVRGIESPGMLCAEDELGLGESHAGIIVIAPNDPLEVGREAAPQLQMPDEILDLAVGPNRPDCLGHIGVARELAAHLGIKFAMDSTEPSQPAGTLQVVIDDSTACSRYHATILEGVTVGPSPLVDQLRLGALGVRAISNVVDVTNLAMLEHGQPLHAFDLDTLPSQTIRVRRARTGETLQTLDGNERKLEPSDVLICDGNDRAIALAGVMGGKATEVTARTQRILLESATFSAASIRATGKRLGLRSEASHRFERGVDPSMVAHVAYSAAQHLADVAGAKAVASLDEIALAVAPTNLVLRADRTRAIIGRRELATASQARLLEALGLGVRIDGEALHVTVPTFRPDLTREIDLIEEVLRLHGYDRVESTIPALRAAPPELKHRLADRTRDLFNALGFDEAITYAFVAPRELAVFALAAPLDRPLRIANPLREEQSALRTMLLPGLVRAAARNVAHGVTDVRLFEVGHVFSPKRAGDLPEERRHVAAILSGTRDGWLQRGERVDYFDLRGVIDELCQGLGHNVTVERSEQSWLHPGVQGVVVGKDGVLLGHLGELHPHVATALDLRERALVVELDLSTLAPLPPPALSTIPRFPAVERDISFLIEARCSAAEITRAIAALEVPLLAAHAPREDYRDPSHVPPGQKSMLWSFTYRAADRTLTDVEVKKAHDEVISALTKNLGLRLR